MPWLLLEGADAVKGFVMRVVIKYRNPHRPDEAGMVLICDQSRVVEIERRLQRSGFVIVAEGGPVASAGQSEPQGTAGA
jgi:hypothetical protein